MSQAFFFAVPSKNGDFANRFLDAVLQCCPIISGRFSQLDAHFSCRFPEFGRGGGNFFEKKQNKSCCFQNVFNFPVANFLFARTFYNLEKNISKLADLLGHSSIETTRIYIMESGAEFVLLYVVNMQLTEYASVFLCSLHAEMTGTQILQGRCNLTSEIVGNRLHKCGLCLPGGSQQRLWFAQHFGWKANWARWPLHCRQ